MFLERHYLIGAIWLILLLSMIDWRTKWLEIFPQYNFDHLQIVIQGKILTGKITSEFNQTSMMGSIFNKLLEIEKTQGVNIETSLKDLRSFVHEKRKFLKKKKDRILSTIFQLCSLNLFIFIYILTVNIQVGVEINYFVIIISMFLGISVILIILEIYAKYLLKDFMNLYFELIKLKVLMSTSRSVNEILGDINQELIHSINSKELSNFKDTFFQALKAYRSNGRCINTEILLLSDEILYEIRGRFQKFDENSKTIKMISIILFVLPVFLIVNYKILERII